MRKSHKVMRRSWFGFTIAAPKSCTVNMCGSPVIMSKKLQEVEQVSKGERFEDQNIRKITHNF